MVRSLKVRDKQRSYVQKLRRAGTCSRCGSTQALEFHHRNPAEKYKSIADLVGKTGWETLLFEISKCDLLCKDCHDTEHKDWNRNAIYKTR
jgi:5-methylcytosine-specific restriction endonuclease McrA